MKSAERHRQLAMQKIDTVILSQKDWEWLEAEGARSFDHTPYVPGPDGMSAEEADAYIRRQNWRQHEHDNADRQNVDYAAADRSEKQYK